MRGSHDGLRLVYGHGRLGPFLLHHLLEQRTTAGRTHGRGEIGVAGHRNNGSDGVGELTRLAADLVEAEARLTRVFWDTDGREKLTRRNLRLHRAAHEAGERNAPTS